MNRKSAGNGGRFPSRRPAERALFPLLVVAVVFSLTFAARTALWGRSAANRRPAPRAGIGSLPPACSRIVSLAPSITEVLFALGLGDRVVGVSEYTHYPPGAVGKPRVGGYLDPNYEAIVRLRPDLVVLLGTRWGARKGLEDLELRTLSVNQSSVEGILDSIVRIGSVCGRRKRAARLAGRLEEIMGEIRRRTRGLPRPRVMIVVGRNFSGGTLADVYVSGHDGFYNRLVTLAGGVNVYEGETAKLPLLSREALIHLDPDVIIDMVGDASARRPSDREILRQWRTLPEIKAVREGRVYVFHQDYAVIPGPRFVLLLEDLARALHPEAFGKSSFFPGEGGDGEEPLKDGKTS